MHYIPKVKVLNSYINKNERSKSDFKIYCSKYKMYKFSSKEHIHTMNDELEQMDSQLKLIGYNEFIRENPDFQFKKFIEPINDFNIPLNEKENDNKMLQIKHKRDKQHQDKYKNRIQKAKKDSNVSSSSNSSMRNNKVKIINIRKKNHKKQKINEGQENNSNNIDSNHNKISNNIDSDDENDDYDDDFYEDEEEEEEKNDDSDGDYKEGHGAKNDPFSGNKHKNKKNKVANKNIKNKKGKQSNNVKKEPLNDKAIAKNMETDLKILLGDLAQKLGKKRDKDPPIVNINRNLPTSKEVEIQKKVEIYKSLEERMLNLSRSQLMEIKKYFENNEIDYNNIIFTKVDKLIEHITAFESVNKRNNDPKFISYKDEREKMLQNNSNNQKDDVMKILGHAPMDEEEMNKRFIESSDSEDEEDSISL